MLPKKRIISMIKSGDSTLHFKKKIQRFDSHYYTMLQLGSFIKMAPPFKVSLANSIANSIANSKSMVLLTSMIFLGQRMEKVIIIVPPLNDSHFRSEEQVNYNSC